MPLRPLRDALGTWSPGRHIAPEPIHAISAAWPGIAGPDVAANSAPLELSGDALVVMTSSSAWSQQLQMLSPQILRALREVTNLPPIARMTFRSGRLPGRKGRVRGTGMARSVAVRAKEPVPAAAADPWEALERLRRRMTDARRGSATVCAICGAPLEAASQQTCAPCAGAAERDRGIELQRLVYTAPWLGLDEIREMLPGTTGADYERARRALLQRWWLVLERAKRSGTLSRSGVERKLASSYVLLQSWLRPEKMTEAIVRNVLGPELDALLRGVEVKSKAHDKAPPPDSSKSSKQ